jgi:hypothetical protein
MDDFHKAAFELNKVLHGWYREDIDQRYPGSLWTPAQEQLAERTAAEIPKLQQAWLVLIQLATPDQIAILTGRTLKAYPDKPDEIRTELAIEDVKAQKPSLYVLETGLRAVRYNPDYRYPLIGYIVKEFKRASDQAKDIGSSLKQLEGNIAYNKRWKAEREELAKKYPPREQRQPPRDPITGAASDNAEDWDAWYRYLDERREKQQQLAWERQEERRQERERKI